MCRHRYYLYILFYDDRSNEIIVHMLVENAKLLFFIKSYMHCFCAEHLLQFILCYVLFHSHDPLLFSVLFVDTKWICMPCEYVFVPYLWHSTIHVRYKVFVSAPFCIPRYGPPTRTENRLIVENLSSRVSWQVRLSILTIAWIYIIQYIIISGI